MVELTDIPYALSRGLRKLAVWSLPVRSHLWIADKLGYLRSRYRGVPPAVRNNLEFVFGDERRAEALDTISTDYARYEHQLYLYRILPLHRGFRDTDLWRIDGLENLDAALKGGRGVVLATAHLGFPHMIPEILRLNGYNIQQVVASGERLRRQRREEEGVARGSRFRKYIHFRTRIVTDAVAEHDIVASLDVRPILQMLDQNGIVMIAGDGEWSTEFEILPLLEREYPFPVGFIKLAVMTGAAVLPAFCIFDSNWKMVTQIHPPLDIDSNHSMRENVAQFAKALEQQISRTPHQWLRWRQERWFEKMLSWVDKELPERYKVDWGD